MRMSDWSSDVCSSDLKPITPSHPERSRMTNYRRAHTPGATWFFTVNIARRDTDVLTEHIALLRQALQRVRRKHPFSIDALVVLPDHLHAVWPRSEEHTSELQSLMRISYAVFCLKK